MIRIPFILLSTSDGSPLTGEAPSVTISKDGAAFTAATNTPAEIGNGYYYVDLTTAETTVTNNVIVRATATNAQPTAVVWEPEANIQSELTTYGAAKTSDLTGLATSQDITNSQAVIVGAMPTTAGLATTSDVTTAQAAIIAAMPDISGLSTFDPATDTVTIDATQAAGMQTATGFATPANITDAVTTLETYGDGKWLTADVSSLATSAELTTAETNIVSAMPTTDITAIKAGLYNWELVIDGSTESITAKSGSSTVAQSTITRNSAGEIVKMEETE